MQIKMMPLDQIEAYENNPRLHPPSQVEKIAASIKEFGFNAPILLDQDNKIIAGHGRIEAAKLLKLDEVPTISLEHLTPEQANAFRVADNRLNELGGWDEARLVSELNDLIAADIDPIITGYEQADIDLLQYNWPGDPIDPDSEWQGMPEYQEDPTKKPIHTLTIQFYTKKALRDFEKKINTKLVFKGSKISSSMRLPPVDRRDADEYAGEEGEE